MGRAPGRAGVEMAEVISSNGFEKTARWCLHHSGAPQRRKVPLQEISRANLPPVAPPTAILRFVGVAGRVFLAGCSTHSGPDGFPTTISASSTTAALRRVWSRLEPTCEHASKAEREAPSRSQRTYRFSILSYFRFSRNAHVRGADVRRIHCRVVPYCRPDIDFLACRSVRLYSPAVPIFASPATARRPALLRLHPGLR